MEVKLDDNEPGTDLRNEARAITSRNAAASQNHRVEFESACIFAVCDSTHTWTAMTPSTRDVDCQPVRIYSNFNNGMNLPVGKSSRMFVLNVSPQ